MNKNKKYFLVIGLLAIVFTIYFSFYFQFFNKDIPVSDTCILQNNKCELKQEDLKLGIVFNKEPVTEEEVFFNIALDEGWEIKRAWVEGVNMYMGKSPAVFENPKLPTQGLFFLGSCNLEKMEWRLIIDVQKTLVDGNDTAKKKQFAVSFLTHNQT